MKKLCIKRFSQERRILFIACCAVLSLLLVCGVILSVYVARVLFIKANGIELKPSGDHKVADIEYYLQNDSEWGGEQIGSSNRKMSSAGCLVTCIASAMSNLGVSTTPGDVNRKLTSIGGYEGADLIWYKISEAFPEIDYAYSRVFSSKRIESDLKSCLLPIVNVRLNGTGVTHWLLIIGAEDGEFLAFDPLNANREPIKLSKHGKVYSYRVLVRAVTRALEETAMPSTAAETPTGSIPEGERIEYKKITPEVAESMMDGDAIILDVRTSDEYNSGHIRGAVLLPHDEIAEKAEGVITDKNITILVYCRTGVRSEAASRALIDMGYISVYDFGGIISWHGEIIQD